jgi:long-chain fatty acid transport protein
MINGSIHLKSAKYPFHLASGIGLSLVSAVAHANGYHFLHQSAEGIGTAYAANATSINDISAMFSNPASITRFDGLNVSTSATLDMPRSEFFNISATTYAGSKVNGEPRTLGQPIDTATGAATYASYQFSEKVYFGLSFTAPYAYVSEYEDTAASRYTATLTKLFAYNLSPVVAWKANEKLSLSAGLNIQLYKNDVNTMLPVNAVTPSPATDVESRIRATDISYGFSLGVEYELSERTRLGASYRSTIDHDFTGIFDLVGSPTNLNTLKSALNLASLEGQASFSIATPSMLQFGIKHSINDKLELYGNANLTGWHAFKDTVIRYSNGFPGSTVDNDWDDSWYVAVGAGYQLTDTLKVRAGVAYDWTPTPAPAVSPRAPNNDRMYGGLGLTYQRSEHWKFDAGYMFIRFQQAHVRLAGGNNLPRGTLSGDLDLYANVFMFQLNHKF